MCGDVFTFLNHAKLVLFVLHIYFRISLCVLEAKLIVYKKKVCKDLLEFKLFLKILKFI